MLVELADAAVDVIGDTFLARMTDCLLDRLFQQHVLVGVLLEHPLQQQRSPRLFQLCPILLTGFIKLILIGHVPDRLNVEPRHLLSTAAMDATVVEEQI